MNGIQRRPVRGAGHIVSAVLALSLVLTAGAATASATSTEEPSVIAATDESSLSEGAAELVEAAATGDPVVVDELTTETQIVRALPTGTLQAELSAGPARVKASNGDWAEIDTTLVRHADGSVGPRVSASPMVLSGGGNDELIRIADGDASLALGWRSELPTPELSGSTATYREVLPEVDLVVEVGAEGFSTFLIVGSPEAAADPAVRDIRFDLSGSAVNTRITADGGFQARDSEGRVRFESPVATAWDSAEIPPRERDSVEALIEPPMEVVEEESEISISDGALVLTPDTDLLDDPDTVYPVVIDPAISTTRSQTYWVSIQSNGTRYVNHATEKARVGRVWGTPTYAARALYRFDTSAVVNKQILDADFTHRQIHSPNNDCNLTTFGPGVKVYAATAGISSSTTWSNQPGIGTYSPTNNKTVHGNSTYCSGYTTLEWDVKSIVDAAGSTLTLGMISSGESDQNGWRKFEKSTAPLLVIKYNTLPNTPGTPTIHEAVGSASPFWSFTPTPTIRATVSDPDGTAGGKVSGDFRIYNGSTLVVGEIGSAVNTGSTSSWTVPSGKLTEGVLYTARVYGRDDLNAVSSSYSSVQFRVDLAAPAVPTVVTKPTSVMLGQTATYTLTSSADVVQFCAQIETSTELCYPKASSGATSVTTRPFSSDGSATVVLRAKDGAGRESSKSEAISVVATSQNHMWALDGFAGPSFLGMDDIGSLNLTFSGGASTTTDRYGTPDGAALFNSPSKWAQTAGPALNTAGKSFSVSAWVRPDGPGSGNATAVSQLGTQAAAFALGTRNGKPAFTVKTSDSSGGTVFVEGLTALPLGQWTQLVGMYTAGSSGSPGSISLYVNGGSPITASVSSGVFNATGNLIIGRGQAGGVSAESWAGAVDEVLTFPGVLTPAQILQLQ